MSEYTTDLAKVREVAEYRRGYTDGYEQGRIEARRRPNMRIPRITEANQYQRQSDQPWGDLMSDDPVEQLHVSARVSGSLKCHQIRTVRDVLDRWEAIVEQRITGLEPEDARELARALLQGCFVPSSLPTDIARDYCSPH